jgi:hypothetical protein
VSLDLVLGSTTRDWSCGASRFSERSSLSPRKLGETVQAEFQRTFDLISRLTNEKKLPPAERRSFGPLMQSWYDYSTSRRKGFDESDVVTLLNFLELCRRARDHFVQYDKPSPTKATTSSLVLTQFRAPGWNPRPPMRAWKILLGTGLALAGLALIKKHNLTLSS